MSPLKQLQLIKDVIKITKIAKENKLGIFTDKKLEVLPFKSRMEASEVKDKKEERASRKHTISGSKVQQNGTTNRYKINIGKIEDEILKEKEVEIKLRDKGKKDRSYFRTEESFPNHKLFVTEANYKESRMLPSLQKSKFKA